MFEDKIWKPKIGELLIVYLVVLFLVGVYTYWGIVHMPIPIVAIVIVAILTVLFGYLTFFAIKAKTDDRIMVPVSRLGTLLFLLVIVDGLYLHVSFSVRTISMLSFGIPFLAAMVTQILFLQIAKGSKV